MLLMRTWLIASLLAVLLFGCALPKVAPPATPPAPGTLLFKDDFASPASGWDHTRYEEGIMDYDGGAYRMLISSLNSNFWSTPHKDFTDVRIEVDAGKLGGPDENRIGLICRSDSKSYYFFMVSSDGYYGLGIFRDGKAALLGQDQMKLNSEIHAGIAVNHLRFDCSGTDLAAFANGFKLADVHDSALKHGDVGLLAGTFHEPGADIVFDNFVVLVP